jgi:hypothetical protein
MVNTINMKSVNNNHKFETRERYPWFFMCLYREHILSVEDTVYLLRTHSIYRACSDSWYTHIHKYTYTHDVVIYSIHT